MLSSPQFLGLFRYFNTCMLSVNNILGYVQEVTMTRNIPKTLAPEVLKNIHINKPSVDEQIHVILRSNPVVKHSNLKCWLLKAVTLIDLTTLSGDDTAANVTRLCVRAANPLASNLLDKLGLPHESIKTAAVCVYPNRVADAHTVLQRMGMLKEINIASVATGFPSGLYPLASRLEEIKMAIESGANEIDVVLDRSLVLTGQWETLYNEVYRMRTTINDVDSKVCLKVILGVGELGTYENVYKASMVSMIAGADFIKTSTGKEAVNATLPVGLIMCRAIREYHAMTGVKVGLKPAGGIKTARDAVNWLVLVATELGPEWLTPKLFRIGASSLLDVIETDLGQLSVASED